MGVPVVDLPDAEPLSTSGPGDPIQGKYDGLPSWLIDMFHKKKL